MKSSLADQAILSICRESSLLFAIFLKRLNIVFIALYRSFSATGCLNHQFIIDPDLPPKYAPEMLEVPSWTDQSTKGHWFYRCSEVTECGEETGQSSGPPHEPDSSRLRSRPRFTDTNGSAVSLGKCFSQSAEDSNQVRQTARSVAGPTKKPQEGGVRHTVRRCRLGWNQLQVCQSWNEHEREGADPAKTATAVALNRNWSVKHPMRSGLYLPGRE